MKVFERTGSLTEGKKVGVVREKSVRTPEILRVSVNS